MDNIQNILITGSGSQMQGVGRLNDGRAVFVAGALPGEEVRIRLTKQKERFAEAELLNVLSPVSERVTPKCPHYGICGGCHAQHMTYKASLELKRQRVYDALTHIGGIQNPLVLDTLPSPDEYGYRNKGEFSVSGGRIGVNQEASHKVIDTDTCLLQHPHTSSVLKLLRSQGVLPLNYIVTRVNRLGDMMVTLSHTAPIDLSALAQKLTVLPFVKSVYSCRLKLNAAHALDGACKLLSGEERLSMSLCGLDFSVSPQSFFQVNTPQAERLYTTALELAELDTNDSVCDVYCGAGTISLCAARLCANVTGIEIIPQAIRDADRNAALNNIINTRFIAGDAAKVYPQEAKRNRFDTVIIDPPRAGADKNVLSSLVATPAQKLIYISCAPATLARDIKQLTSAYSLIKAQPVDMFPWTGHVETVVLMSRKNG